MPKSSNRKLAPSLDFLGKIETQVKKFNSSGRRTVEERVGHIPIKDMFAELDSFFTDMQRCINEYKKFRNEGNINASERAVRLLLHYKEQGVKYRRFMIYIRKQVHPYKDYRSASLKLLRQNWDKGNMEEVERISKELNINTEDFIGVKFRVGEYHPPVYELTEDEKFKLYTGSKYPILKGKPEKLYSHHTAGKLAEYSKTDRRKDATSDVRYRIIGVRCPDDWEHQQRLRLGAIIQTTKGEKYQIHKIFKNTAIYSKKRQPDGGYVKEKETKMCDITTDLPSFKEGMAVRVLKKNAIIDRS